MIRRDLITVADLEVYFRVGVPDSERARPQRLLLTLAIEWDFTAAAAADDLSLTVNYFEVSQRLRAFGAGREWKLIETLAVDLAMFTLSEFGVPCVSVEVKKFILPEARWVSVRVERRAGERDEIRSEGE